MQRGLAAAVRLNGSRDIQDMMVVLGDQGQHPINQYGSKLIAMTLKLHDKGELSWLRAQQMLLQQTTWDHNMCHFVLEQPFDQRPCDRENYTERLFELDDCDLPDRNKATSVRGPHPRILYLLSDSTCALGAWGKGASARMKQLLVDFDSEDYDSFEVKVISGGTVVEFIKQMNIWIPNHSLDGTAEGFIGDCMVFTSCNEVVTDKNFRTSSPPEEPVLQSWDMFHDLFHGMPNLMVCGTAQWSKIKDFAVSSQDCIPYMTGGHNIFCFGMQHMYDTMAKQEDQIHFHSGPTNEIILLWNFRHC